jgi:hypothetical protein
VTAMFDFRRDWAVVHDFFSPLSRVPADKAGFVSRYGSFENEASVEKFTAALRDLDQIGKELGGPDSLKRRMAEDSEYLLHPAPPDEVYARIVGVSMRASDTANAISSTYELLPNMMEGAGESARDRAQRVRQMLAGSDGLASQAAEMVKIIQDTAEKVASYGPRLTKPLLAVHDSEIVNQTNSAISDLKVAIPGLQKRASEAAEKAKGWFGAEKAKEEFERLTNEIAGNKSEIERKALLESDMGDFFVSSNKVAPALASSADQLRTLGKAFQDLAGRINDTCRLATGDQLGDPAWLAKALNLQAEIASWKELQSAAQKFTQEAIVSQDR